MSQEITQLLLNQREHPSTFNYDSSPLPNGFFERYHFLNPGKNSNSPLDPRYADRGRPLGTPELILAAATFLLYAVSNTLTYLPKSESELHAGQASLEDTVNVTPLVNPNNMISWPELLALNPDIVIGDRTVSKTPKIKPRDAPASGRAVYNHPVSNPPDSLTTRTLRYGRNLNDNLRKLIGSNGDPTELYNHTYKEGNRNESTYKDFLGAWLSAQLKDTIWGNLYTAFLKENTNLAEPLEIYLTVEPGGSISFIKLGKPDGLIDNYGIEDLVTNRLIYMPKVFVPLPEDIANKISTTTANFSENRSITVTSGLPSWAYRLINPFSKSASEEPKSFKTIFPQP